MRRKWKRSPAQPIEEAYVEWQGLFRLKCESVSFTMDIVIVRTRKIVPLIVGSEPDSDRRKVEAVTTTVHWVIYDSLQRREQAKDLQILSKKG